MNCLVMSKNVMGCGTLPYNSKIINGDIKINGDINNHIAEHHLKTNHRLDWDSAECVTYSTDHYQRITLESWFTNLEQTPPNRCQQLPAPYKRMITYDNKTDKQ